MFPKPTIRPVLYAPDSNFRGRPDASYSSAPRGPGEVPPAADAEALREALLEAAAETCLTGGTPEAWSGCWYIGRGSFPKPWIRLLEMIPRAEGCGFCCWEKREFKASFAVSRTFSFGVSPLRGSYFPRYSASHSPLE